MKTAQTIAPAVLALIAAFAAAPQARADRGRFNVKNCADQSIKFCLYDWEDGVKDKARDSFTVAAGMTDQGSCRRSWFKESSPGCKVHASFTDTCGQKDLGKRYSGPYTITAAGSRGDDARPVWLNSGFAESCSDPDTFVLTGSEVSGCTPEITIYGKPDMTKDGYKLRNFAMSDMTRFLQDNGNMNDWVRTLKLSSGRWQICEHVGYQGECFTFGGGSGTVRLDTDWNGKWSQRISSIRPVGCN